MKPKLYFPSYEHQEMVETFVKDMETMHSQIHGMSMYPTLKDDFSAWIQKEKQLHLGINLAPRFVPGSIFLYILDSVIIGTISIRHCLNDSLEKVGGHIGYSIHPAYRMQGHATKMLQEALAFCQQWEIWPVLITCDKDNIGSKKTILKCGGILENEWYNPETKNTILRYWIGK